ncbi:DNA polymerase III subunit delta' [Pelistega sp. MC2]|uniref:DNA polymerase III subunit delta' n=1 Tax=Pelistega sp. MC2 TaxID=1720297 RepID=UPI00210E71B6|nr:DNA polymerase III subunit delta' [Pelistega sp. MC2]
MNEFYPWQKQIAQEWLSSKERFSHAWLIHGQEGIGKLAFCIAAAKSLLCEKPQHGLACGHCQSCHWMDLGNHLDYRLIIPDALKQELGLLNEDEIVATGENKLSTEIKVEQIRQNEEFMTLSTSRGGYRVIVLGPAESLNTVSANAILKVLEEPAKGTIFLLFSHATQKVLPTILSRCRRLALPIPETSVSLQWLKEQGIKDAEIWLAANSGAPLSALKQSTSEVEPLTYWLKEFTHHLVQKQIPNMDTFVTRLEKIPASEWIRALQCFVSDLSLVKSGLSPRFYQSLTPELTQLANNISKGDALVALYPYLASQQRIAKHPLNAKLFIQSTLQKISLACIK